MPDKPVRYEPVDDPELRHASLENQFATYVEFERKILGEWSPATRAAHRIGHVGVVAELPCMTTRRVVSLVTGPGWPMTLAPADSAANKALHMELGEIVFPALQTRLGATLELTVTRVTHRRELELVGRCGACNACFARPPDLGITAIPESLANCLTRTFAVCNDLEGAARLAGERAWRMAVRDAIADHAARVMMPVSCSCVRDYLAERDRAR